MEIRTGTPVTNVRVEGGGSVVGGETPTASLSADVVVNTVGAWGGRIAAMAGLDLPISLKRRQLLMVEPERSVPDDAAWTADLDAGAHFRPDGGGRALVGGIEDPDDAPVDPARYSRRYDEGGPTRPPSARAPSRTTSRRPRRSARAGPVCTP